MIRTICRAIFGPRTPVPDQPHDGWRDMLAFITLQEIQKVATNTQALLASVANIEASITNAVQALNVLAGELATISANNTDAALQPLIDSATQRLSNAANTLNLAVTADSPPATTASTWGPAPISPPLASPPAPVVAAPTPAPAPTPLPTVDPADDPANIPATPAPEPTNAPPAP